MVSPLPSLALALSPHEREDFFPPDLYQRLRQMPVQLVEVPNGQARTADWAQWLQQSRCQVLMTCWSTPPLPPNLPVGAEGLNYLLHLAGSVRHILPRELLQKGLRVSNWGASISRTVAECTLLLVLSALRRAGYWNLTMHRDGSWKVKETVVTQSLFGRRVGIHGFGQIARELVPLLRPFNVEISALSPHMEDAVFAQYGVRRVKDLEELFAEHDVVVELAPYTAESRGIVTEDLLRRIPEGGAFVNVGRGAVVDEEALIRIAEEGRIQIALDVYATEPLPVDSRLRQLDNVMLLPHLGGPTKDRRRDCGELALQNLERFLRAEPLEAELNLEIYDRSSS